MFKKIKHQIGVGGAVISPYAKKLVNKVLDSGRLSYGPFLRKFEEGFGKLCDRKFAVSANSGTSALQVAIHALKELDDWKDGDEILVPAVTFVASSNTVIQNNLRPVFVDVDPKIYHINPRKIEEKITSRTRAIMPVHLFGISCDMKPILVLAKKHKLRVIEDSCEAIGVKYYGKMVGSLGDVACFSTYVAHLVTTGVGGFAATNDSEIAIKIRSLINHGRDSIYIASDDDKNTIGKAKFAIADRRFSFESVGYSYRLTEFEGALGVAALREFKKNLSLRQKYATYLIKGLKPYTKFLQLPQWPTHSTHAFMMFPLVIINNEINRADVIEHLENHNVETRYLLPLINQPIYKKLFGDLESRYPVAANLNKNGFYIGCHPEMKKSDLDYILKVFGNFFSRYM